jgi:hypothetical protein
MLHCAPGVRAQPLGLVASPPVISPGDAAAHVDEVVIVETSIAKTAVEAGRVYLMPAEPEAHGFRIVFVPPLGGNETSEQMAARYRGRKVRAIGRVREFGGQVEMFVADSARLEVPEQAASIAEPSTVEHPAAAEPGASEDTSSVKQGAMAPTAGQGASSARSALPPVQADRAVRPEGPAENDFRPAVAPSRGPAARPTPGSVAGPSLGAESFDSRAAAPHDSHGCAAAREEWRVRAAAARAPLGRLDACLAAGTPPCAAQAGDARAALADVAAAEERIRWLCSEAP